jgi:hypothetical protein
LGEVGLVIEGHPSAHKTTAWLSTAFRKIKPDTEPFNRMVRIGSKNLLLAVAYHHYNAKKGTPEGGHWREIIKLNGGKVKGKPEPVAMPLPATIPPTPRELNMDDIDVIDRKSVV